MRHDGHAIFDVVSDPEAPTGASVRITSPDHIVKVADEDELVRKLESYKDFHATDADDMLHYVEKIRPALRYYCGAYEVGVPDWLQDDSHLLDMEDADKEKRFGTSDVRVREFRPIVKKRGMAVRATR